MKKAITFLLLLANLYTGLAFAWDSHPEAMVGHDAVMVDLVANDHEHPDGDQHHEDHCCHGAAHMTGIFEALSSQAIIPDGNYHSSFAVVLPSLYITPLLRPPIV